MSILQNILLVLSTGYIFVYFSEHLFWARLRPDDSFLNFLLVWAAYSLMAYVFLVLVSYFTVKNIWALFLAGAAFGWIGEGLVVQTTYEMLPLSLSFTGLAWHALITVLVGWYGLRKALLSTSAWPTLRLSILVGVGYGLWAISWWLEADGGIASVAEFAAYSFITTALVILSYEVAGWSSETPFAVKHWAIVGVGGILVFYFIAATIPLAPIAILLLPMLMGVVYLGLRKNRQDQGHGSLLETLRGRISPWNALSLLALPAVSVFIYGLAVALNLRWHTNIVLYLVTTPLGFILFGMSLIQVWRYNLRYRGHHETG